MDARLADRTLKALCSLHELADHGIRGLERRIEVGRLRARLLEGDFWRFRNVGGKLVRLGKAVAHHAPHVLDRRLCGHLPERHDVSHMIGSVLLRDVVEHELAPGVVEVHVYIGHGDSVGVEESLEKKIVLDRVHVCDPERIRHGGAGRRSAPRTHPHAALLAGGADVVVHDEEVSGEAHGPNSIELELDALGDRFVQRFAPAALCALPDEMRQIFGLELNADRLLVSAKLLHTPLGIHSLKRRRVVLLPEAVLSSERNGDVELRHNGIGVELVLLDTLGHLESVGDKLRILREKSAHIVRRLEPLLAGVDHALRIGKLRAGGKREENVMRVVIFLLEEVDVVRGHHADVELLSKLQDSLHHTHLALVEVLKVAARIKGNIISKLRGLVEHHLKGIIIAEKILVPSCNALGLGHVALIDCF